MGSQALQLLATLYVALSLTLFAWGGADPTDGFCLRTLSCSWPTTIMGPVLDTVSISHTVVGTSREEMERHVNMGLLFPFTMLVRARRFASSVLTLRGYKDGGRPCTHLHPLT
jgi:hypothetical protein